MKLPGDAIMYSASRRTNEEGKMAGEELVKVEQSCHLPVTPTPHTEQSEAASMRDGEVSWASSCRRLDNSMSTSPTTKIK